MRVETMDMFEAVPIPDVAPTDERFCVDCGDPLPEHSGRGRKPTRCDNCKASKTTGGTARTTSARGTTKVVNEALGTMDGLYAVTEVALMVVSPDAATSFTERRAEAQTRNRAAFESNRKLAASVAKAGQQSGTLAFILAQVYLTAPSVVMVAADIRARRKVRVREQQEATIEEATNEAETYASRRNLDHFL